MSFFRQHKHLLILILILLFGFAIRFYNITYHDIWRDEAFSIFVSSKPIDTIIELTSKDTSPPLHYFLLHFWMSFFGDNELSVRSLSLIFGMLTIPLIYELSKVYFDKKTSLLATFFGAINPLLIVLSIEARTYSLLIFLVTLNIFSVVQINKNATWRWFLLFIISTVLGLYSHNIFIVPLVVNILFLLISIIKKSNFSPMTVITAQGKLLLKLILSLVISVLIFLPWGLIFLSQLSTVSSGGFWLEFKGLITVGSTFIWFFTSDAYNPIFDILKLSIYIIISFLGLVSLGLGFSNEVFDFIKTRKPFVFSFIIIANIGLIFLISYKIPFLYIRYISFLVPIVLILCAYGINKFNIKVVGVFTLIFSLLTILFYGYFVAPARFHKAPFKDLISQIDYQSKDIILHPRAITFHPFRYYSELKSYIYDPRSEIQYYEGLAVIEQDDYFNGDLSSFDRIWVIDHWYYPTFSGDLENYGFSQKEKYNYDGNLSLELWSKD